MMRYDPDQVICLNIPDETSHIITADGEVHQVHSDATGRYINIKAGLAHAMLCNLPDGLALREANVGLAAALGPYTSTPGISLRYLEAATRPPSRLELVERALADRNRVMR
jgi:hypothetical protein